MSEWKTKILADYPDQMPMLALCEGTPVDEVGDSLAVFVYQEVMDSESEEDAYNRLMSARRDLEMMISELDQRINMRIDENPASIETPLGEQQDTGGELEG